VVRGMMAEDRLAWSKQVMRELYVTLTRKDHRLGGATGAELAVGLGGMAVCARGRGACGGAGPAQRRVHDLVLRWLDSSFGGKDGLEGSLFGRLER